MSSKRKVLVYTDFEIIRSILIKYLSTRNLDIIEASTYEKALDVLNGSNLDLLITDNDMKRNAALAIIKNMREMTSYTFTPIISLITGNKELYIDKYKDLNIACFLTKPFDVTNFYSILNRLISIPNYK